ncbi:MAG: DUF58 domain-containing protein [Anaerolinea sp.]|nr:DUF58 domain-containing protein [Anaerolinea sp.]
MPTPVVFDDATRRKLEQLMLSASRVRAGAFKGERRSNKRGTSIEFADYRDYAPGDDLRRLDWNIYARLQRPLTKLYEDEEDLAVHLLIDASASMNYPVVAGDGSPVDPDAHKFTFAQRLAAGIGYISLLSNDRFSAAALAAGDVVRFGPARGRGYGVRLLTYINALKAGGALALTAALKRYATGVKEAALVLLISDLFSVDGWVDGITALQASGCEIVLIHTLAAAELEPPLAGDLRLIDCETGATQDVSLDAGLRDQYRRRVDAWRGEIRSECARRGVHYVPVITSAAWEKVILYDLRRAGVVK